jgi:D-lactate dehydrogenase (cytochrome)
MTLPVTSESVDQAARDAAIASLRQLLGARLSSAAQVCEQHGKDASYHPYVAPDAVAFAQSTEEVSEIVTICARHKVPLIPFGAGTGMEGNVLALRGGVCIDISGMNRILQVSTGDLDATVEAGVTHEQLNEYLRDKSLFFRLIREPMPPSAAWPQLGLQALIRCATARCAKTYSRSRWCCRMDALFARRDRPGNLQRATT